MKNRYGLVLYVFFTVNISFGMEDNMGQYYQDFNTYQKTIEKVYAESKTLDSIIDRLIIAQMVLDFYQDQKQRSAYNDQQFFYEQQRSLQEKLLEIKNRKAEKSNTLKNNGYFLIKGSFENQLDDINVKINNILNSNQELSIIIEQLDKNIPVANNQFKIDLLKNTKLLPQQKNGTLQDKILYATELLTAIDSSLVDLKQHAIDGTTFTLLTKKLVTFTNKLIEWTINAQIDQPIILQSMDILASLKSLDILKSEKKEQVLFTELCTNAQKDEKCNFIFSWENFCSWKKNEAIHFPDQNGNSTESLIEKYIKHKIDKIHIVKNKLFNDFSNLTIGYNESLAEHYNKLFKNVKNDDKTRDEFTEYVNIILGYHCNELALLSANEQEYCTEQLLKSAGFLFVKDIDFVNDIATLPFDELLFLGSIFYDDQKRPGNVIPSGYITDYIQTPNQKRKTLHECIQMHLYNYRKMKKKLFPTDSHILLNQSMVLHALARVNLQDIPIGAQDLNTIKKILQQSTPENQGLLLGSVYGFCRFINQYSDDKDNNLLSNEPFFEIWHNHFQDSFNPDKPNFESHSYEAIEYYLINKNPLLNKHFKSFLNGHNNEQKDEDDDVLKNRTYGGGLSWRPNGQKKFFIYNKKTLDYIINVIKMTKPIVNNRKINDDQFFKEARQLYDQKLLDDQKNAKEIKFYTDLINEAEKNQSSEDDIRTFLARRLKKEAEKEFKQYKKNNTQIELSDIIYVYSILMHGQYSILVDEKGGQYITSVACPSIFNKNASLPEFAKKYKKTLIQLNKLKGFEIANKKNEVLGLMFINWWGTLYKPTAGQTFEEYRNLKNTLLEKAGKENDFKRRLGYECSIEYLLYSYLNLAKETIEFVDQNGITKFDKKPDNENEPKEKYVFYAIPNRNYGSGISEYFKNKVFHS